MSVTGLTGTSVPARNVDSTAGREPSLPMPLLRWMSVERGTMNRVFRGERSSDHDACPGTFPVLFSAESVLTRNTVSVRMGPLPREDVIGEFIDLFQDAFRRKDPEVMLESALWFYSSPRNFDPAIIGGLMPIGSDVQGASACQGSVVLMGGPPELRGTQLDGTIEMLGPGDDHYEFLLQAWKLFMVRGAAGSERACLFRIG